jgi:hypothetical protein
MIFDGQEGSLLAADAHHHRSGVALIGVIHRSYVSAATNTSFSEAMTEAMISFCYQEDADHGGTACRGGVEG